jgi:cyanophycinase
MRYESTDQGTGQMLRSVAYSLALMVVGVCVSSNRAQAAGSLVIAGGALRFDDPEVWTEIVELAGGPKSKIAIIPTASANPSLAGKRAAAVFTRFGADPVVVPLGIPPGKDSAAKDQPAVAVDPQWAERVRSAGGVYFAGGEQARITDALRTADGKATPLLDAIWDVYRRGGVIAGTSAGAAIMSHFMYRDAEQVLPTLQHGVKMGKEVDYGLGFIGDKWFVEQHCLARGRFARALVLMQHQGYKFGIGVDENTALVVRHSHEVKVIGYKGAVVMDLSQASRDPTIQGFNIKNVKLTYLDRGDQIDLDTAVVTPSEEKRAGVKLDPNSADFSPHHDRFFFSNDILGNTTVAEMLARLINNKKAEAIGLAFDGYFARQQTTQGFEFRFYRAKDSLGWCTEAYGGEDYTVTNIHLDIRPVDVMASFYRPAEEHLLSTVITTKPAGVPAKTASVQKTSK